MLCAADGHEMMIARLLQAGADVCLQDVMGHTPLHEAVRCRAKGDMRSVEAIGILLDAGAPVNLPDRWNEVRRVPGVIALAAPAATAAVARQPFPPCL